MNQQSKFNQILPHISTTLLLTYLLITLSRWFHPALFNPNLQLGVLVLGMASTTLVVILNANNYKS